MLSVIRPPRRGGDADSYRPPWADKYEEDLCITRGQFIPLGDAVLVSDAAETATDERNLPLHRRPACHRLPAARARQRSRPRGAIEPLLTATLRLFVEVTFTHHKFFLGTALCLSIHSDLECMRPTYSVEWQATPISAARNLVNEPSRPSEGPGQAAGRGHHPR